MGVIRRILFRGDILGRPRHRNLFLDMEENIHIHFRDLRIELSRAEFEEIAAIFSRQSAELLGAIRERDYQDGHLPNANQEDVRIWTDSRLQQEVKYHPRRFSLEECSDGYHFHYRNYKLLLEPDEFRQMASMFRAIDLDAPYPSGYDQVRELLEANDVDFVLAAGNLPGEVLAIIVAHYHLAKVRDVLVGIGFDQEAGEAEHRYLSAGLTVRVRASKQRTPAEYRRLRGLNATRRLFDFLATRAASIDANTLNLIKCQVLDLYYAMRGGQTLTVDIDPQSWLYSEEGTRVIFPYGATAHSGGKAATGLYKAWSTYLASLQLGFVKPVKGVFPAALQRTLKAQVEEAIHRDVAAFRAVERIYLMGSALRGDMGRYQVPLAHGNVVKLGSDVDILVEIDPEREKDMPPSWHLMRPEASNHCAVYHVGQVPLPEEAGDWHARFPNIQFAQHLLDAYVHFPSRGFVEEKDAFLRKFGAQLVYQRERGVVFYHGEEEERIAQRVTDVWGLQRPGVERMKASTENALFRIITDDADYVLKLFKVSGNYRRERVAEHVGYEAALITALRERGVETAAVLQGSVEAAPQIEGFPALLFERIPGEVQQRPEYPLERICRALASIHNVQLEQPLDIPAAFNFDETCMIWLPAFHQFLHDGRNAPEVAAAFATLSPLADRYHPGPARAELYARSPSLHCHGDVTPKNLITGAEGDARFFDFNNAFFGPRMVDVVDGAFEFSLAEKYFHMADFSRFDAFVGQYAVSSPLKGEELADLTRWLELIGIIKFAKEIRVLREKPEQGLRRKRALAIAEFVAARAA